MNGPHLFAFTLGPTELIVVVFVVGAFVLGAFVLGAFARLLLFGHRLPAVLRSLGQGLRDFRSAVRGGQQLEEATP